MRKPKLSTEEKIAKKAKSKAIRQIYYTNFTDWFLLDILVTFIPALVIFITACFYNTPFADINIFMYGEIILAISAISIDNLKNLVKHKIATANARKFLCFIPCTQIIVSILFFGYNVADTINKREPVFPGYFWPLVIYGVGFLLAAAIVWYKCRSLKGVMSNA